MRGDADVRPGLAEGVAGDEDDWTTEYLAPVISVAGWSTASTGAIAHIARYGSNHTEASSSPRTTRRPSASFNESTAPSCMHNASTQFADGGEFGMGAEIGIATGKMHARGPVGVEQLTSFKYLVRGTGQVRP